MNPLLEAVASVAEKRGLSVVKNENGTFTIAEKKEEKMQ